ncbi:MAG: cytochrome b/b6 domain-containing protein [Verrucomicrobiales bacterium]|nr:cytochrome b/b6 domain-containing protein [Verrucomicrobiales bacterium]
MKPTVVLFAALAIVWSLAAVSVTHGAEAEEWVPNDKCLECHGQNDLTKTNAAGRTISLFVDEAVMKGSVHATNSCISCHRDLAKAWEHPDDGHVVEPVNCAICHEQQSLTANASAHAIALRNGTLSAATCKDCHGQHNILAHGAPDSPTHFTHLAETCGQCHTEEASQLAESVHGIAAARGDRRAPTCIDCHSEHQIEDLRGASPIKIAEQVCGKCHASLRLNTRFNVRRTEVDTFLDSYHGLAAQGGSTKAANCASCHGWHNILASTDPRSTIHAGNLVKTCGQCHPGIGTNFASGKVHMDDTGDSEVGMVINRWVRRIYLAMIVVVVGLLGLHNGAAWFHKARAAYRAAGRTVIRMDVSQRRQHLILLISFIVLAITGFALRFPDSMLFWMLGTEEVRRWLHRAAGVVLLGVGGWHMVYIAASTEGRRLVRDLWFRTQDWRDLKTQAGYLAGRHTQRAKFGRFGYAEKIEYWAVVWGTIIMGVTGLAIWWKVDFTRFLPRWLIDVAITIHYYEAILACLAIIVWHFYHVIFDPDVYPASWAWLDGRVTKEWQKHEHPLEPLPETTHGVKPTPGEATTGGRESHGRHPRKPSGTDPASEI